jgi:hypothetical protein
MAFNLERLQIKIRLVDFLEIRKKEEGRKNSFWYFVV